MSVELKVIQQRLDNLDFVNLFIEDLGWSYFTSKPFSLNVPVDLENNNQLLEFSAVAKMGEVPVFTLDWPYDELPTMLQRRAVHETLSRQNYEHLLIYVSRNKQHIAFVWARRKRAVAKQVELRTLPYEVGASARTTVEQLAELRFTLQELEIGSPDLVDVLSKLSAAFNVEAVTQAFFGQYRAVFELVEQSIDSIEGDSKRLFTQKLFNRLMFIRFLEKRGWLTFNQRSDYLRALWEDYQQNRTEGSNFYQERLQLLFFAGLNNPSETDLVTSFDDHWLQTKIGRIPYLNGGLFEKDDEDGTNSIFLSDTNFASIINELLYRFNFTVTESTPLEIEVAVDPEMLGRIFEKLVTGRRDRGSYYTPRTVVTFMCREALKGYLGGDSGITQLIDENDETNISLAQAREYLTKLNDLRVVDPACGSGAYLLGLLQELLRIIQKLDTRAKYDPRTLYDLKLSIIRNCIYGVDIDLFAVNIARLRLWLSLIVDFNGPNPPYLPNLNFRIEQGDSLISPNPSLQGQLTISDELVQRFQAAKVRYMVEHDHHAKLKLKNEIDRLRSLIGQWARKGHNILNFDWAIDFAEVFARQNDGGFDIILANPPYGAEVEDNVRDLYFDRRREGPQSKDTYGLFMARALQLLRPGGHFCFIVSDTWRTIRSHRPLRRRLLEKTTILHVLDLPTWIFDATVNTCIMTLHYSPAPEDHKIITGDLRGIPSRHWQSLAANLHAIARHGEDAQTLEYARYTYRQHLISTYDNCSIFIASPKLYSLMINPHLQRLGSIADVKQGLITADNQYYITKREWARGSYSVLDSSKFSRFA